MFQYRYTVILEREEDKVFMRSFPR